MSSIVELPTGAADGDAGDGVDDGDGDGDGDGVGTAGAGILACGGRILREHVSTRCCG
jgi:hypothetical protein